MCVSTCSLEMSVWCNTCKLESSYFERDMDCMFGVVYILYFEDGYTHVERAIVGIGIGL